MASSRLLKFMVFSYRVSVWALPLTSYALLYMSPYGDTSVPSERLTLRTRRGERPRAGDEPTMSATFDQA